LCKNGMTNFCTTFVYTILDSITDSESLEMVKTIARIVKDRGIFISCTAGGSVGEVIKTVECMAEAGVDAVFVHPPLFVLQGGGGELYFNYLL